MTPLKWLISNIRRAFLAWRWVMSPVMLLCDQANILRYKCSRRVVSGSVLDVASDCDDRGTKAQLFTTLIDHPEMAPVAGPLCKSNESRWKTMRGLFMCECELLSAHQHQFVSIIFSAHDTLRRIKSAAISDNGSVQRRCTGFRFWGIDVYFLMNLNLITLIIQPYTVQNFPRLSRPHYFSPQTPSI